MDGFGHLYDLRLALHGAGASHDGEVAAAHLDTVDIHDGIFRMELTVGLFIRLGHPHDSFHILVEQDLVDVNVGGISHQTQDTTADTVGDADLQVFRFKFCCQLPNLVLTGTRFHNDDHKFSSFLSKKTKPIALTVNELCDHPL